MMKRTKIKCQRDMARVKGRRDTAYLDDYEDGYPVIVLREVGTPAAAVTLTPKGARRLRDALTEALEGK